MNELTEENKLLREFAVITDSDKKRRPKSSSRSTTRLAEVPKLIKPQNLETVVEQVLAKMRRTNKILDEADCKKILASARNLLHEFDLSTKVEGRLLDLINMVYSTLTKTKGDSALVKEIDNSLRDILKLKVPS